LHATPPKQSASKPVYQIFRVVLTGMIQKIARIIAFGTLFVTATTPASARIALLVGEPFDSFGTMDASIYLATATPT